MKKLLILAVLPIMGCASVIDGSNQSLSVKTTPVSAKCSLTNDKGIWYVDTPGSVTVHRAYGDLEVKCKQGEYSGLAKVKSSTKGMAFGNIILGGGIGAGVDIGTGAAYDYPGEINVKMSNNVEIK